MLMTKTLAYLLLDTSAEYRGGQRQVILLAEELHRLGEPVVVGLRPGTPIDRRLDPTVPRLPVSSLFEGDPFAARRLGRAMAEFGIDLVNAQASHDHLLAAMAVRLGPRRPPVVVTRRVDFVPGRGPFNRWKYRRGADRYIAISRAILDVLTGWGSTKTAFE
ncbi:MAG: glycosyltransferase family 4 protein [Deltaproteobacteria bacterium]|nr:glycosyltransferase family 4 protein [Deltaproteobacteria bacterium]